MTTAADLEWDFDNMMADPVFGDDATYTPAGGSPVSIKVFPYRKGANSRPQRNAGNSQNQELTYDRAIGVSRADVPVVTKMADRVSMALNVGGTPQTFVVSEIIRQDPGVWTLGLSA